MKYLKKFENHQAYETAESGLETPNVSYCVSENEVHYKPIPQPKNVITYKAPSKLNERTTTSGSGMHIKKFSGESNNQLTIVSHTFENGVGTVTFDDDIYKIGNSAFSYCNTIEEISIPDSVITFGTTVFYYCGNLKKINIPSGVTFIGAWAFRGCSGLTSIEIPSGVTSIEDYTFEGCSGLTSFYIHDSVTNIGQSAFENCSGLTAVTIGSGVTSIESSAFRQCVSLTGITILAVNPPSLTGYVIFGNTNDCPIYVPAASVDTYKAASSWGDYASRIQAIP